MSYMALVMKTAVRNNFRLRSVFMVSVGVALICVIGLVVLFGTQFIRPEVQGASPDRSLLENFFGLVLYTTSVISIGIFASVFAFQSLTREKARGNIQALLATPLAPGDIWLGKSLAVFLPGMVMSWLITLAVFLAFNFIFFVPTTGFILTPWMLLTNFVAIPLVYLVLTMLMHAVGLISKPMTANIIGQIFLPVILTVMINLAVRDILNAGSWLFTVTHLIIASIIAVTVLGVRSKVYTEKIILSA